MARRLPEGVRRAGGAVMPLQPGRRCNDEVAPRPERPVIGWSFGLTYTLQTHIRQSIMKPSEPTKLTLRLDAALIDRAKGYAHEQDRSLSQLVADYFSRLTADPARGLGTARKARSPAIGPITAGLRGVLRPSAGRPATGRDDYRSHLEDKYL